MSDDDISKFLSKNATKVGVCLGSKGAWASSLKDILADASKLSGSDKDLTECMLCIEKKYDPVEVILNYNNAEFMAKFAVDAAVCKCIDLS